RPTIIYQRHRAFLVAGLDLARRAGARFVLEWNSSEAWTRANWDGFLPVERIFNPLVFRMERHLVRVADLAVAVSRTAADAALQAGGLAEKVIVVPNGVDIAEVDRWAHREPTT